MAKDDEATARREGAVALLKMVADPQGREVLRRAGHVPGETILVALESDTIGGTLGRIIDEHISSPAVVCMVRRTTGQMVTWGIRPSVVDSVTHAEGVTGVQHGSTLGMLYDYMAAGHKQREVIEFAWAGAAAFDVAGRSDGNSVYA